MFKICQCLLISSSDNLGNQSHRVPINFPKWNFYPAGRTWYSTYLIDDVLFDIGGIYVSLIDTLNETFFLNYLGQQIIHLPIIIYRRLFFGLDTLSLFSINDMRSLESFLNEQGLAC